MIGQVEKGNEIEQKIFLENKRKHVIGQVEKGIEFEKKKHFWKIKEKE